MNWKFWKREPEERSTAVGYTASLVTALQAGAEGGASDSAPLATAALEACAGLYARAFAAATVTDAPDVADALTPPVLAQIARDLLRRGESHHSIDVAAGKVMLRPLGFAYAHGDTADPMRWTYSTTEYGPTDSRHRWLAAARVLHCRYATDAARPWLGVPPWSWAAATSQAIAALDRLVANEAAAPAGSLLMVPKSPQRDRAGKDRPLDGWRSDLAAAKGRTLVSEDAASFRTEGPHSAGNARPLQHLYFGFQREYVDTLRTATGRDVALACGIPATLTVANSDGTAQRESYRRFLHTSLRPMARIIEAELRMKLDAPNLTLDLSELGAADTAGKARAFKAFVESGLDPEDAARETGVTITKPVREPTPSNAPPRPDDQDTAP